MTQQFPLVVTDTQVVAILAKKLRETHRNPSDLLAVPEYKDNKQLLLAIALASFLQGIANESTREDYRKAIQHFASFLHHSRTVTLLDAIGWDVAAWREDLAETGGVYGSAPEKISKRRPNSPSSIETKTSAVSSFYEYLGKPGFYHSHLALVSNNPVAALPNRHKVAKYGQSQKIGLKAFKAILDQINLSTVRGLRDYNLLYGYYITGRRHSEWARLQWQNIDWNNAQPSYVYTGKGQKTFRDVIPKNLLKTLTAYLRARWGDNFKQALRPNTYLFTSLQERHRYLNEPLVESSVLRLIKTYAKKADLSQPEKTIIHSLRHLHAEAYLAAGANIETVRSRLQHQNLDTTQIYASSMNNQKNPFAEELLERFKQADPPQ